jgi:dynein heavy chain
MDYKSLGETFAGLALSGSWGCFDEFNRIQLEVLSVVAQQIQIILDAIRKNEDTTNFQGEKICVERETGIFITMNPGYAGRSELPDNLKALFRPVSMMVPDFIQIARIILMSEGFQEREISTKVVTIYELMAKQLSKADHYDFSMRAIKSVLNAAGAIKRGRPELDEFGVMIKAIRDMNLPKFLAEDVILFDNLFLDLFPGCDEPENDNDPLQIAIEDCLKKKGLQLQENIIVKIIQLFESNNIRHGNMLVGKTMSGKTTCWQILSDALNLLQQEEKAKNEKLKPEESKYKGVKWDLINPKAVNTDELFGYFDNSSAPPQWCDGILSTVLKKMCQEPTLDGRWLVLDGPVDTLWIESMNSVLDDNKLLTLNNGDRIGLSKNVRLLFEVENLSVASPATVSRAGMIYLDLEEMGWKPIVAVWVAKHTNKAVRDHLTELFEKYVGKVLSVKRTSCKELVVTSESACVQNLCGLFDALCANVVAEIDKKRELDSEGKEVTPFDTDGFLLYIEKWFAFCLIWSVGATVDEQSRKSIDYLMRDIESMYPHSNTVFEHYVNTEKRDFAPWEEQLQANWKPTTSDFHKIYVPTVDVYRNKYILQSLMNAGRLVLLVGMPGVGKTALAEAVLMTLDHSTHHFTINFSSGTTSNGTQDIIESHFNPGPKNKYKPPSGKKRVVCFIDDLNMPRRDTFFSQPPLELIRQWLGYDFWYDRVKIVRNQICDM